MIRCLRITPRDTKAVKINAGTRTREGRSAQRGQRLLRTARGRRKGLPQLPFLRRSLVRQLDVPVGQVDEVLPGIVAGLAELEMEHRAPFGPLRLVKELQAGLARRAVALALLHGTQEQTMFSQEVSPPRSRGMTWSRLRSLRSNLWPQYWQVLWSRSKMLWRVELDFLFRHPVEKEEQDHLGHANREGDGADDVRAFVTAGKAEPLVEGHGLKGAAVGIDDLCMTLIEKHESALDAADVDGLPETIEHEDVVAQDRFHDPFQFRWAKCPRLLERVVVTLMGRVVSKAVNNCQPASRYIGVTALSISP